ncbi:MAG TPA: CHASE4 domain-containing protein [Steroidobacteraceae bacterium]|nr:CHASE4 domain-containing protein [Steroidobacteraceae bacterium]
MMNLRLKVIALLALMFAILSVLAIAIQTEVVMPSFTRLERSNALTSMKRVRLATDRDLKALQVDAMDWANWGDAYRFVQDHNRQFIRTNVTESAVRQVRVDTIVFVDLAGHIVLWSGNVLPTRLSLQGSLASGASLRADFPWRKYLGTMKSPRGLIRTNLGVMLMAGAPILNGTGRGRPLGMVIMGRLLSPARMHGLASQTQTNITMVQAGGAAGTDRVVDTSTLTEVFGTFTDVYRRPLMTLRVDVPRAITARGRTAIHYASASIVAAAIAVLALVVVLLNRLVLAPLTRVTRHAVAVANDADLSARLNFTSKDEFGRLAREFDRMVERLADVRRQLADQSFQAGFAEMAKGIMHNLGNALTPLGVRLAGLERRLQAAPVEDLARAVTEIGGETRDAARHAALVQFAELGCRQIAQLVHDSAADVGIMQRQTAMMRAALSEHMLASASRAPVFESVKLTELVAQSLELVPDASRQRLQIDPDESLQGVGAVRVVRNVLRLVLQNLIINAAEAVRDVGKSKGMLRVGAEILREADRDQLHLHCRDDGVGIASEDLERVFEKGFTTKSGATNHGIGLHWCANAIRALGGRIWAVSDGPGRGASMHLILPLGGQESSPST